MHRLRYGGASISVSMAAAVGATAIMSASINSTTRPLASLKDRESLAAVRSEPIGRVSGTGLVLGVEADIQGASIDSKFSAFAGNTAFDAHQSVDWFATARGRIGYASNRTLVYATGGVAYGGVDTHIRVDGVGFSPPFSNNLSKNDIQQGFVYGGGIEYAFSPSWSLKAEYQFVDLGSISLTNIGSDSLRDTTNKIENNFQTARLGLNYKIRSAYDPLR